MPVWATIPKMGTNDTSNQTGMLVVKKEGKEYATTTFNAPPCGHFQNQGKKSVVGSDDETLEILGTCKVVDLSEHDMFPVAATKDEKRPHEKEQALKKLKTVSKTRKRGWGPFQKHVD